MIRAPGTPFLVSFIALMAIPLAAEAQEDSQPLPDLPLPTFPGTPLDTPLPDIDAYDNPLLLFDPRPRPLPMREELAPDRTPDLLPPLAPSPSPPASPPDPSAEKLKSLAKLIAPSVVALKVWDEFGTLLVNGVGSYVSPDGVILTDAWLLRPELVPQIDYITATTALGESHRITGWYETDMAGGHALLQSSAAQTTPLQAKPGTDFSEPVGCHVLASSEKRGLVLAEGVVRLDSTATGLGWLDLRGSDSPGDIGSPVLDSDGRIIAIIGMKVPLKDWMNFALPVDAAALAMNRTRKPLKALDELPKNPTTKQIISSSRFLEAFEALQNRRIRNGAEKLVRLANSHPRSAEVWALLGLAASYLNANEAALNCQRKAVALEPRAGLYWHQLAYSKIRENSALPDGGTEDREALERAVAERPDNGLAWYLLAARHIRDGDLGRADEALRKVLLLSPGYAQAHYLQAYVRGRLRDYAGAEAAIERSLKLDPGSAEAWYYRGLVHDWKGDYLDAAEAFKKATRYRPTHPQAWLNLAHAYRKAGRSTEAREAFITHQKVSSGK